MTLAIGLSAAVLTVVIGITVGALSGYYGGWVEEALMRLTEFFQVLPTLLFSMVIVALFGASLPMITFAIGHRELDRGGARDPRGVPAAQATRIRDRVAGGGGRGSQPDLRGDPPERAAADHRAGPP